MYDLLILRAPKSDYSPSTCEDAWGLEDSGQSFLFSGIEATMVRRYGATPSKLAISDGASTCSASGPWASLLVNHAVQTGHGLDSAADLPDRLKPLRQQWRQTAEAGLSAQASWNARAALEKGAHATLLMLRLGGPCWTADAVGDSNLFQIRGNELCQAFPVQDAADFEAAPCLVASVGGWDNLLADGLRHASGVLEPGDVLVLATDAAARWLMETVDWAWPERLLGATDADQLFLTWVREERTARRLKDDDTTLVILQWHHPLEGSIEGPVAFGQTCADATSEPLRPSLDTNSHEE
jgi:hypothetical protein